MSSTGEHVKTETFEFQAEIKQLLNILVHWFIRPKTFLSAN
jgi:hypothetical protein